MIISQNMEWLRNAPISHRGLHSNDSITPENSLLAFSKAIDKKYAIELDVQLTKDNILIVFHDYDLLRMCNDTKKVCELNLEELKEYRLLQSKETIPTFDEVLQLVNCRVPILIEIKSESNKVGPLESTLINILNQYKGEFAVQSFNPNSIIWIKRNAPNITRGQLSSNFEGVELPYVIKFILKNMLFNIVSQPHFIAYEKASIKQNKIQKLRMKNKILLCWTVISEEEMYSILPYCDNIIFESFQPKSS